MGNKHQKLDKTDQHLIEQKLSTGVPIKCCNLETFSLLWLDANVDSTAENRETQIQLRATINYLKTFHTSDECEEYIRKIKGVFIDAAVLIKQISFDQQIRSHTEETLNISVYSYTNQQQKGLGGTFIWFQLLIDVLFRLPRSICDMKELVVMCKESYEDNPHEESIMREFELNYCTDRSIWWYTRDCCLYRILNKALRLRDIDILFSMRFFIKDISDQLKREHQKFVQTILSPIMKVYRGQAMAIDELNNLRSSEGYLISMNSFLSTSHDKNQALIFVQQLTPTDSGQRVLFEIIVDTRLATRPFADISHLSYFKTEQEVLFTLGSIFRLKNVIYHETEQLWNVKMELCNSDDQDLKQMFDYIRKDIGGREEEIQ
ncbi:unnamed protein product [Didymodactylos carnosus]|uniref:NAD(P)(+)--arginine ADP-ribosyltransferase n=1 Tax=Didymodactylos carnosus TaxID=1234261 RepID=A0A815ZIP8_9BILA|nr:unnamed protein product [Didymodactylos carnosus]CAF4452255.1 unnamed protein product [Didymodactylos carnosus]